MWVLEGIRSKNIAISKLLEQIINRLNMSNYGVGVYLDLHIAVLFLNILKAFY